jgi:hypothetical protein
MAAFVFAGCAVLDSTSRERREEHHVLVEGGHIREVSDRAYDEVNAFEKMLVDDGVCLVKLFLHILDEEQLRRFRERVITPTKHWKMTGEDIRNRARRREYLAALDDMFALTSTAAAPWYVVPAEYKWYTRIAVATTAVKILAKGIAVGPPALDPEVFKAAKDLLSQQEIAVLGLPTSERSER